MEYSANPIAHTAVLCYNLFQRICSHSRPGRYTFPDLFFRLFAAHFAGRKKPRIPEGRRGVVLQLIEIDRNHRQ